MSLHGRPDDSQQGSRFLCLKTKQKTQEISTWINDMTETDKSCSECLVCRLCSHLDANFGFVQTVLQ